MFGLTGFKRWIFLGVVLLATFLGVAAWVFRADIVRTSLDPRVPFQTYRPPRAPDYAQPRAWALRTTDQASANLPADVFFIHPTTFDGGDHWNGPIGDEEARRQLDRVMLPNYAGPFARVGRIFAPRYRQASLYSQLTRREDARAARRFAYGDIQAAFRYWRAHDDQGRPLVLVGVEQGGLLAARLLAEEIDADPALRRRLAAVYLIETVVPADNHGAGAADPACASRAEAGCVVAWVTPRDGDGLDILKSALVWNARGGLVELEGRQALCVNPMLGGGGDAQATPRENRGAVNATGLEWGLRPALMQRQVSARCVDGLLQVTRPRSAAFRTPRGWADQLKVPPWNLFYADLEADAQARVAALSARAPDAAPAPNP